ncbi:hypothetical protein GE061_009813 [Apolygus lucorum]|uniref:DUF1279 domain-containing protein n=1 Tax=Apolygus lucorum TaxID=248454 RepID=A0A8S9Y2M8_APOLU|nr:hypothetical protein GE061_009813 [Apolygus lucorum]
MKHAPLSPGPGVGYLGFYFSCASLLVEGGLEDITDFLLCAYKPLINTCRYLRYTKNNVEWFKVFWSSSNLPLQELLETIQIRFTCQVVENSNFVKSPITRFKTMYKDYWYVLIPVHVVTSCVWFGAFFYTAQSGFDIAGAIEFLNLSDEIMDKIRHSANSTAGHITLAYLLYKIFTPLRYTVTLGGTTYSIKFLTARGLLKKMPKKEELKQMYEERKDLLKEQKDNFKKGMAGKFSSSKKTMCDDASLHDLKSLGGAGRNQPLLVLKTPIPALASRPILRGLQATSGSQENRIDLLPQLEQQKTQ